MFRSILFNVIYGIWSTVMHIVCMPLLLWPRCWIYAAVEIWIDLAANPLQLAGAFESSDPLSQVFVGQECTLFPFASP